MEFLTLQNADITIITITYNASKFLDRCLKSLYKACEQVSGYRLAHLVVDGYSTDNTLNIVKNMSPSSTIVQREKRGIYDALNYGISLVYSPYVMYLHADDELDENFLFEMTKFIEKFSWREDILPYGTVDYIDEESNKLFSRKPPFYIKAIQKHYPLIAHPNGVYPTAIEKAYPYNTTSGLEADADHINEITRIIKPRRVPEAIYRFRMSRWSSTVMKTRRKHSWQRKIVSRVYVQLFFESNLVKRLIIKLVTGKTYWSSFK
jgi:glycosyltransferase involved in cell wall biosynthesis